MEGIDDDAEGLAMEHQFVKMLSTMEFLEEITLNDCRKFTKRFLAGPSSLYPNFLPRLKVLTIADTTTLRTPSDQAPSVYRHLSLYPSLSALCLQVWADDEDGLPTLASSIPVRLPSIKDLDLILREQVDISSAEMLLLTFNRLSLLSIRYTTETHPDEFGLLLNCIEPEHLTTLNLWCDEFDMEESIPSPLLEQALGRFPHLRHLKLHGIPIDVEFLNSIDPQPPLETLVLCPRVQVNLESLLKILRGPTKLRHLKLLNLSLHEDIDNLPVSLENIESEAFVDADGVLSIDYLWEARLWPSAIRRCELKELIKVASQEGVVLQGNVEELSVEYEDEVALCAWFKLERS